MQLVMRNRTSIELRDSQDNMFFLLQGLPGFFGPVGETGITGEKVSKVSFCPALLLIKFCCLAALF